MSEQVFNAIVVPVKWTHLIVAPLSVARPCSRCQQKVWVAPTTFAAAFAAGLPLVLICVECLTPEESLEMVPVAEHGPTPEQIAEAAEVGVDISDIRW